MATLVLSSLAYYYLGSFLSREMEQLSYTHLTNTVHDTY